MLNDILKTSMLYGVVISLTSGCAGTAVSKRAEASPVAVSTQPFMAQVVGVQWLNPLQRKDYPTEWQLLWTLGLVQPNKDDDMVELNPGKYKKIQPVGVIAKSSKTETFKGFHRKYFNELTVKFHDIYFSDSRYFYNAHSVVDKGSWRELAGIHVEYAVPKDKLEFSETVEFVKNRIIDTFSIGNVNFPTLWTRNTPPSLNLTMGGANAGFISLKAGLEYLQKNPNETVWVMNWDAPNFPKDKQINENMVLLVLAGPNYNTERAPLAWMGYPDTQKIADFEAKKGHPPRVVQSWKTTIETAARNAGKQDSDIGYVIHDANNNNAASSDRIANLAQTLSTELVEFDFMKQSFDTPALLGEMGAGTALTNVALGIAYVNHFGKNVLVAGTTDTAETTAVVVVPPEKVRLIDPEKPWFRARGGNNAFLPWWGLRHDAKPGLQGYSK